jgi:hypothetical protein
MLTILNTSIVTNFGKFNHYPVSLEDARKLVKKSPFQSAIGHQSTADLLTVLLDVPVPMNRIQYVQTVGESALVFKLNGRPEEGRIYTVEEIQQIGYSFSVLQMVE